MELYTCSCGASTTNEDGICDFCRNDEESNDEEE
jgi:hypothetical protein